MKHRGRFQAQGRKLESSESWAQDDPLYLSRGHELLMILQEKIPAFERVKRESAFLACEKFMGQEPLQ